MTPPLLPQPAPDISEAERPWRRQALLGEGEFKVGGRRRVGGSPGFHGRVRERESGLDAGSRGEGGGGAWVIAMGTGNGV